VRRINSGLGVTPAVAELEVVLPNGEDRGVLIDRDLDVRRMPKPS